jgi:putative endonuclease
MHFENIALRWLKARGLKTVAKNYHSRAGEIDLIMLDQESLCFIEVKYRTSQDFGGAAYSIPRSKQQKIIQTALSFISHQTKYRKYPKRFDALLIEPGIDEPYDVNWIKDAFSGEAF